MLFNLTASNSKKYYDLDTVIIPYINDNWHALQLPPKVIFINFLNLLNNLSCNEIGIKQALGAVCTRDFLVLFLHVHCICKGIT